MTKDTITYRYRTTATKSDRIMTDTNDIAAPIADLITAAIAAVDKATRQWTGLDWSTVDAIDELIKYAEAQLDDDDAHQLVAPDADIINAAYHGWGDGSHTEQQLSDRSRRALDLYEQAESASEWRDALDELTAVRDELEARELLAIGPALSDAEQALRLLESAYTTRRDPTGTGAVPWSGSGRRTR